MSGTRCICGCGETPLGGRFRPGHDARHAAAVGRALKRQDRELAEDLAQKAGWTIKAGRLIKGSAARRAGDDQKQPSSGLVVAGTPGPSGTVQVTCPGQGHQHLFGPGAIGHVVTASCGTRLHIESDPHPLRATRTEDQPERNSTMKHRTEHFRGKIAMPLGAAPRLSLRNRPPQDLLPEAFHEIAAEWDQFKRRYQEAGHTNRRLQGDVLENAKRKDQAESARIARETGKAPGTTPEYDRLMTEKAEARAFLAAANDTAHLIAADFARIAAEEKQKPEYTDQRNAAIARVQDLTTQLQVAIDEANVIDAMYGWVVREENYDHRGNPAIAADSLPAQHLGGNTMGHTTHDLLDALTHLFDRDDPPTPQEVAAQAEATQRARTEAKAVKNQADLEARERATKPKKSRPAYFKK